MRCWLRVRREGRLGPVEVWVHDADQVYEAAGLGVVVAAVRARVYYARVVGRAWDDCGCELLLEIPSPDLDDRTMRGFLERMRVAPSGPAPGYEVLRAAGWSPVSPGTPLPDGTAAPATEPRDNGFTMAWRTVGESRTIDALARAGAEDKDED